MRIIKLSKVDEDFSNRDMVGEYFEKKLKNKVPEGKFELTKTRIAKNGISPNEKLIFTYEGEIVYLAEAATGRETNKGKQTEKYPYCFYIDMESVRPGHGALATLESKLKEKNLHNKNIVKSQAWPIVEQNINNMVALESILTLFIK